MLTDQQKAILDRYADVFPSQEAVEAVMDSLGRQGRCDWQAAPMMAERLRHIYPRLLETSYPELKAANGMVLPIDTTPSPADETWRQYTIDQAGRCDWIDDDGSFAPSNSITLSEKDGRLAEFGHKWDLTIFDVERAAKQPNFNLPMLKGKMAKRAHDEWKNWVWLFGDKKKELEGLMNGPFVEHLLAAQNGGATSRLWANKSDAEILTDVQAVIDTIPDSTVDQHYVAKVFLPPSLVRECRGRLIDGTASGTVTLWDVIKNQYSGDDSGQPPVKFMTLNECDASRRKDPKTGTDTSGLSGDVILATIADDPELLAFMSARPFSQRPPQEEDLKIKTLTHEKIGGTRFGKTKLAVVMRFGTT